MMVNENLLDRIFIKKKYDTLLSGFAFAVEVECQATKALEKENKLQTNRMYLCPKEI